MVIKNTLRGENWKIAKNGSKNAIFLEIGHGIAIFTLLDWVLESIDALVTKYA